MSWLSLASDEECLPRVSASFGATQQFQTIFNTTKYSNLGVISKSPRNRQRPASDGKKKTTGKFRAKLLVNLLVNQAKSKEFQGDFMGVEDKFRKIYGSKLWVVYHRQKSEQGQTPFVLTMFV